MQEMLKIRTLHVKHVHETFDDLKQQTTKNDAMATVPAHIQQQMATLNSDWLKIQKLVESLQNKDIAMEGKCSR